MKRVFLLFSVVISYLTLLGCSDSSSDNIPYSCSLPCLEVTPVVSASTVSSSTGGTVDVTINILGDITQLSSLNITLRSTTSGHQLGSAVVFDPTQTV